ncbi:MAG: hypothetical protein AB7N99_08395 [Simkaniaceae bacterium]
MATIYECPIALTRIYNPVEAYIEKDRGQEAEYEVVGEVEKQKDPCCAARFNLEALSEYIASKLVGRVEVLCPQCRRKMDGIRLFTPTYPAEEDVPYDMQIPKESPAYSLARKIIAALDNNSKIVQGGQMNELSMREMVHLRDEVVAPIPVPRENPVKNEDECFSDDCLSKTGIVAGVVAVVAGLYATLSFVFGGGDSDEGPKKNPHHQGGSFVDTGYLNTSPLAKV